MGDETVYLHTWGSRRHIASDHDGISGIALCGQQGYTEAGRFRHHLPSQRARRTILTRPVCARCEALSDGASADPGDAELVALRSENERLREALTLTERALRDQPMQAFRTPEAQGRRAKAVDAARAALSPTQENRGEG